MPSMHSTMPMPVTFTFAGARAGARLCLPLALSAFAYGLVFGVLARQAGLSMAESLLMSGGVFAGSSQLIALQLWAAPLPVWSILVATLVVNLRHMLMGATLRPLFAGRPLLQAYGSIFFLTDETWAITTRELSEGRRDGAFLLGSGLTLFTAWCSATALGQLAGGAVADPAAWGFDFAFTAVVAALVAAMWRGKSSALPWTVAALVSLAAYRLLPSPWYIVCGGLAGSLVGARRHAR